MAKPSPHLLEMLAVDAMRLAIVYQQDAIREMETAARRRRMGMHRAADREMENSRKSIAAARAVVELRDALNARHLAA